MPRYYFKCHKCSASRGVLRSLDHKADPLVCACGETMQRDPRGASSKIVETRDNGVMSRSVEQPADVERLMWERAHQDPDKDRMP